MHGLPVLWLQLQRPFARQASAQGRRGTDITSPSASGDRRGPPTSPNSSSTATATIATLSNEDLRQVVARRELYRRLLEAGERLAAVAERIWYAVVKEG